MDKPLSILLVEDEPIECKIFAEYIETVADVRLIGVTNNAEKALEFVEEYLPDAIILDLELHKGGGNGIAFLTALRRMHISVTPYILVTTNNISRITHEQARQLGADFVMLKSQDDYSAENVVEFLRSLKGMIHGYKRKLQGLEQPEPLSPAEMKRRIVNIVSAEIDLIGISPKTVGRDYLIDAIVMIIDGKTKHVLIAIAQKYNKTDSSVERAMQNAINRTWRSTCIDELQRLYTARITSNKGVPTLTEFVHFYANKFKNKY
jgi:DNA-binding NarL/FixJ family response regulator